MFQEWIEPMLCTGLICAVLGVIALHIAEKLYYSDHDKASMLFIAIGLVLYIPITIGVLGGIINILWIVFNWTRTLYT